MKITRTTPRLAPPSQNPKTSTEAAPQSHTESFTDSLLSGFLPGAGGLVLGGLGARLGEKFGQAYGHRVASSVIQRGIPLVLDGTVSVKRAVELLPTLRSQTFHMKVGAISLGLVGFVVGAALLWPHSGEGTRERPARWST